MLQRKLKAALEPTLPSPEAAAALGVLSSFYEENTLSARRSLRSAVEQRGLALNKQLLAAFDELEATLDNAEGELQSIWEASSMMASRLQSTRAATEGLISQTAELREKAARAAKAEHLASAVAKALQLSTEEEEVLNSPPGATLQLDELLSALASVRQVHQRGKRLLNSEFHSLGLQVAAQMSAYEERGFAALCRWVVSACTASISGPGGEAQRSRARLAAERLQERPALLSSCVREVALCRRTELHEAFSRSLAAGGTGASAAAALDGVLRTLARAIVAERDLLHHLFADNGDGDGIEAAVKADASRTRSHVSPAALRSALLLSFEQEATRRPATVSPPLKAHLSTLLSAPLQLLPQFKLACALKAHTPTLVVLLDADRGGGEVAQGDSSACVNAVGEGFELASGGRVGTGAGKGGDADGIGDEGIAIAAMLRSSSAQAASACAEAIDSYVTTALSGTVRLPPSLEAPRQTAAVCTLIDEMLEVLATATASGQETQRAMMASVAAPNGAGALDERFALAATAAAAAETGTGEAAASSLDEFGSLSVRRAIEQLLEHYGKALPPIAAAGGAGLGGVLGTPTRGGGLAVGAEAETESKALPHAQRAVCLLNVIDAVAVVLATHVGAAVEAAKSALHAETEQLMNGLVEEAANLFFARCGLLSRLDALRTAAAQPHLRVSSIVGLEPIALAAAMRAFDSQLFQSGGSLLPFADSIVSVNVRHRAVQGTARAIAGTYRDIFALVTREESGYDNPASIVSHTPEEVETLLDVAPA